MKRLLIVLLTLIMFAFPAVAGDIPESILYYDSAELFVGKVEGCSTTEHQSAPAEKFGIIYLDIMPSAVFKGDLKTGISKRYTNCDHIHILPEKDKEYLFGYIDENNFYIWEIESFDGEKIQLKSKHGMDKRLEEYINDGTVEEAEIKRRNVGNQMTFSEFLNSSADVTESVIITFADKSYEVDKEEFFELSDSIVVTDVKDSAMKEENMGNDVFEDMIFINISHIKGDELHDSMTKNSFAAISKHGEVDRYSALLSRLPNKDFEMSLQDLKKIYSLLPDGVQTHLLVLPNTEPENNYVIAISAALAAVLIVILIITYFKRKKQAN